MQTIKVIDEIGPVCVDPEDGTLLCQQSSTALSQGLDVLLDFSLGCATGGANNRISQENPHVKGLGLHYIWRSGVSRSGMLSFNAARILACSGLGRATRRRASFLPSVVSRRMSPIWISPNCRKMTSGVIGRGLGEAFGRRRSGLRISVSSPACLDKWSRVFHSA